jgi:hypothetical protein
VRTFCEFSSVELTCFELYRDNVAEGLVKELYWDSQSAHGWWWCVVIGGQANDRVFVCVCLSPPETTPRFGTQPVINKTCALSVADVVLYSPGLKG